jgi:hypothetical protein
MAGFEIPRNLTKYAEEFLFGLSLKQFVYAGGFTLASFLIYTYLSKIISPWIIAIIILPIAALGIMFVFFDLETKIKAQFNLKKSLYKASYFDGHVSTFIDVDEIKEKTVILKRGTLLGIIEVKPIDFFILGKEERERVMNSYQNWLRSIDYYVQILSRSVDVDLEKWLKNIKKKAPKENQERLSSFSKWVNEEVANNNVRNRTFYIIIPEKAEIAKRPFIEELKSIFTGQYTNLSANFDFKKSKKALRSNITNCIETLSKCGLNARRLKTNELLGLYSAYFTNQSKINKTVLSPIIELNTKSMEEQEKYYQRLKK